jgi:hypothetical protein
LIGQKRRALIPKNNRSDRAAAALVTSIPTLRNHTKKAAEKHEIKLGLIDPEI